MREKRILKIFLIFISIFLILFFYLKYTKKNELAKNKYKTVEDSSLNQNSNVSFDINYVSYDAKGNKYSIYAKKGEINLSNTDIIYLTEVSALVTLSKGDNIEIVSDFGKYNILNYDTIFSENVNVKYLDNIINAEYLDLSLTRNTMIISKDVVYNNTENILYADALEINIKNKDTKIYMHSLGDKVKIQSK